MITPPFLNKKKTIGIISTARKIRKEELSPSISFFQKNNFKVILGKNIYKKNNQFAGTDLERAEDFQDMINNPEIHAIMCARGGYGTIKIIDKINFDKIKKQAKWIIGFSDITVIHNCLNYHNIKSIHGPMCVNFKKHSKKSLKNLISILKGKKIKYKLKSHKKNKHGEGKGVLVGGNLSIIYSMLNDKYSLNTKNKILFIEEVDEYLYHIDRMFTALKRAGKLQFIKGLIVGKMTKVHDNKIKFGKNYIDIIKEHTKEYKYPICFDFPSGHLNNNNPLIFGNEVSIKVNTETKIKFI